MTRLAQRQAEKADLLEAKRMLKEDWEIVDNHVEPPDFKLKQGDAVFGIEHSTIYSGKKILDAEFEGRIQGTAASGKARRVCRRNEAKVRGFV